MKIGKIDTNKKVFIVAEIGNNHEGNFEVAKEMINEAAASGVDAVKFQTWITEDLCTAGAIQADYQAKNTGVSESQTDMLRKLELSQDNFRDICWIKFYSR